MEERGGRLRLREVVDVGAAEVDIGGKERGPDAVPHHRLRVDEVDDLENGDVDDDQRQGRRGEDPPRAPEVEVAERNPALVAGSRKQEARDQESGQDEEDVDPEEAAVHRAEVRVVERTSSTATARKPCRSARCLPLGKPFTPAPDAPIRSLLVEVSDSPARLLETYCGFVRFPRRQRGR